MTIYQIPYPRCLASPWLDDQTVAQDLPTRSSSGWLDYVFAFHDREEIGPKMVARIAKHTGLAPEDL